VPRSKADDELPRVRHHLTRQRDEVQSVAFTRRVAHCAPKTRRFIVVLRFIAMIMIVHHAASTPK
jgi:hypothetical protein